MTPFLVIFEKGFVEICFEANFDPETVNNILLFFRRLKVVLINLYSIMPEEIVKSTDGDWLTSQMIAEIG